MRNETFWKWFNDFARPRLGARAVTFEKMFDHLDKLDRPVNIVETGCARRDPADDEAWKGDGCSSLLFDCYVSIEGSRGSALFSMDVDAEAVKRLRAVLSPMATVIHGDSVRSLEHWARMLGEQGEPVDLLYLDSMDYKPSDPLPSAIHHHAELMAAMPMIRPTTLVVVDDAWAAFDDCGRAEIAGKGYLVARHMQLCGADLEFCQYQSGWTNVCAATPRGDEALAELVERARAHVEADRVVAAEQLYRLILGMTTPPTTGQMRVAHGDACAFYARIALVRQRFGHAADWYREAIQADPLGTDYRLDLVRRCFLPMGNLNAALVEAERAVRIAPDYGKAWWVLGGVHFEMSDAEKAIAAYEKQLALDPGDPDARLDRAAVALDVSDHDTVGEMCRTVLTGPRAADALHCLGMMAHRESRHEEAIDLYDRAIAAGAGDLPIVHWNKSLALHAIGRYREGWIEHEHREFQRTNPVLYLPMRRFTLPRWRGEPAIKIEDAGITAAESGSLVTRTQAIIHVHYEAGAGDNLALARYLPLLCERGFRVRYECADEMVDLMRSSFPLVEVMPKAADYPGALGIKPFDYHCPIGSLPAVFETDIDSVPWDGAYLKSDPILVDRYRARLQDRLRKSASGSPIAVGICWSSGIRDGVWMREYGARKSMHFDTLRPIIKTMFACHAIPVSLQIGPERAQHGGSIYDYLPERPNWSETAALVANLDLVVAVDTAVAHLAGAMGKPVWVLSRRDAASWHFMCWRPGALWNERSPWYPSAVVFRQHHFNRPHEWGEVISDVSAALQRNIEAFCGEIRGKEAVAS